MRCAAYLLTLPLLAMLVVPASGQELRLAWNECGGGGSSSQIFSCDTNSGAETLALSLYSSDYPLLTSGFEAKLIISTPPNEGPFPDWWSFFGVGACRLGLFLPDASAPSGGCASFMPSGQTITYQMTPLYDYNPGTGWSLTVTLRALASPGQTVLGDPGEYLLATVVMPHDLTAGAGACSGCARHMTVTFRELAYLDAAGRVLNRYSPPSFPVVQWQDPALPVRPSSWGAIKSLYR